MLEKVVSGGQTGADIAGLIAAKATGIETGGWAPRGWKIENGKNPQLERLGLKQTRSGGYEDRTKRNVKDSDGTLIISANMSSPGTVMTIDEALELDKPLFRTVYLEEEKDDQENMEAVAHRIAEWVRVKDLKVLNVAGNRESKAPGLQVWASQVLMKAFRELQNL